MNLLFIGGTGGFIGTRAVRKLAAEGHSVTVFHRGRTNADLPDGVRHIFGDRRHLPDFADEFRRVAPRVVVDMYLRFEPEAVALMQAFRGVAERVVAVSSQDVYRTYGILWRNEETSPNVTPIVEDAPLRSVLYPYRRMAKGPDDPRYSYDKIPVERVVMSDPRLPGTVLRLPATYGPGDRQHRLFEYLKRMDDGRPFIMLGREEARWRQTHGYVENVADAVALAATDARAANRIFNVGEEEARSRAEWVREIGRAVGWDGEVVAAPESLLPEHLRSPASYEHDLVADTGRIRKELGYEERVPRDEALLKTIAWERANPPAEVDPQHFDYRAEDGALEKIKEYAR
ncbi:MAG TPA: NAD-dependent epimerase/dehydratase family protein [Pyrinomonadaceae bacterium]|nr:NAD-dependent epimerase/dehydratase family protein [Pyrinomonadaceae bacterium]